MYVYLAADGRICDSTPPSRVYDGTTWYDLSDRDPDTLAAAGWYEVAQTPRPDDTDTHTHDGSVRMVDGRPVQVWTPRPWTLFELSAPAMLTDLSARVARIEAHLWPPDPAPTDTTTGRTWEQLGGAWPHDTILSEGGKLWRNVSGVPLTTPPSGFPGAASQWGNLFVEVTQPTPPVTPPTVGAWTAGEAVKVGDLRSYGGKTYRVVTGHTTQAGWEPPALPALWVLA